MTDDIYCHLLTVLVCPFAPYIVVLHMSVNCKTMSSCLSTKYSHTFPRGSTFLTYFDVFEVAGSDSQSNTVTSSDSEVVSQNSCLALAVALS